MRTHTGEELYSCKECQKTFPLRDSLASHMATHAGERLHNYKTVERHSVKVALCRGTWELTPGRSTTGARNVGKTSLFCCPCEDTCKVTSRQPVKQVFREKRSSGNRVLSVSKDKAYDMAVTLTTIII